MQQDIGLLKNALSILDRLPAGLAEQPLMAEIEIASGRPLTTSEARDTLIFAFDKGWINSRRDDFERTIYWITDAGRIRLRGF